ncbi:Golgi transport complex subunit COG3 [Sporobolomyces koalae]|uniref:Golgi transport complex subunit COG3 n=1 Tax=Sporobolomyces koalae TaxID=500713 RepID=UPI00317DF6A0
MASSRASTSRLSLEDWDALAPLSPLEVQSVQRVNHAAALRPLPTHLQKLEDDNPKRAAAAHRSRPTSTSLTGPDQPDRGSPDTAEHRPNLLQHPVDTIQHFHDWFAQVERDLEHSQEQVYRQYLAELDAHLATCDAVLEGLDESRGLLSEMEANYRYVEENSRALQLACETMLDEHKHLVEVTDAIGHRLEYFRELESATKMLNLPGEDLVLQDDFLNMIDRLDVCLEYLKANRDFRDAEIYLIRFQQCLTRAMTLIKMYFVSTVRQITLDTAEKMNGRELSDTALYALLYQKFQSPSSSLRILLVELEKRAESDPNEYGALRAECFQVWFAARTQLLSPGLAQEVKRMDPNGTELIKLAKAGCNHLRSVCIEEWSLYKQYFSTGETEVYHFLENLCDHLYDSLRPRILHEPRLDALCELCTVLGAMMALDADTGLVEASDDEDDDDVEDDLFDPDSSLVLHERTRDSPSLARRSSTQTIQPRSATGATTSTTRMGLGRLRFSILLRTILQDTQTRLVFRAQAVVQSQVLHYVPTSEDLDYPAILEKKASQQMGKEPLWKVEQVEDEDRTAFAAGGSADRDREKRFKTPNEDQTKWWFPTLQNTVWVLARLNAFVNTAIFEDFAGEAVTVCQQSLLNAASLITAQQAATSEKSAPAAPFAQSKQLDAQLFLIRHLLLLKETVRSVDLVHIERAADFSSVTDMLSSVLRNTSAIFNPAALFELASKGMPNFAETMVDAKTDLDTALKTACEQLISSSSLGLTSSIQHFLDRCTAFLSSTSNSSTAASSSSTSNTAAKDLPGQPWATPDQVLNLHEQFQQELERQTQHVAAKLRLYLEEEKTVAVLLPPLLEEVVETYTTFFNLTRSEYGFATSSSLLPPADVKDKLEKAAR